MLDEPARTAALDILKIPPTEHGLYRFELLKGDASSRDYYRILSPGDPEKSFVLMKMQKGFNSPAEEITKSPEKIDELPFLNIHRFLQSVGTPVAKVLGSRKENSIIVLEDLGDDSLFSLVKKLSKPRLKEIYESLVDEMVRFQTAGPDFDCIAFSRQYDEEMCLWELKHFSEWAIESFLDLEISASEKSVIDDFYKKITKVFLKEKFYFSHRDCHSRNVMIKNGVLRIIDFQDALLAPAQYDLASLLRDSYVKLDENFVYEIAHTYADKFSKTTNSKIAWDEFERSFDFISVHRSLKAAGRFVYIKYKKGDSSYIQFIPGTLDNVKRNLLKYRDEFTGVTEIFLKYIATIKKKSGQTTRDKDS